MNKMFLILSMGNLLQRLSLNKKLVLYQRFSMNKMFLILSMGNLLLKTTTNIHQMRSICLRIFPRTLNVLFAAIAKSNESLVEEKPMLSRIRLPPLATVLQLTI